MACLEFVFGTYIDDGDFALHHAALQLLGSDFLEVFTRAKELLEGSLYPMDTAFAEATHRIPEREHFVAGQSIVGVQARTPGNDHVRPFEHLQVLRYIGDAHSGFSGELLHGPFALEEKIQQFDPCPTGKGMADARILVEELSFGHAHTIQVVN